MDSRANTGLCLALALCWGLLAGPALSLSPDRAVTQYGHDVWLPEDGLPQIAVQAICQTGDGYLWLGTQGGLVRFDGIHFDVFDPAGTEGLPSGDVRALHEDRKGHLWIGTAGGGLVRHAGATFEAFTSKSGLSSDIVLAIEETEQGLWIGTDAGLSLLEDNTFRTSGEAEGLPASVVRALLVDGEQRLWVGMEGGGVCMMQEDRCVAPPGAEVLAQENVTSLVQTSDGVVWIGTVAGGLVRFEEGALSRLGPDQGLPSAAIRVLLEDRDGNLWIGTNDEGLVRLADEVFEVFPPTGGISHDRIFALSEDAEGSLWVGTELGGLNRLRDTTFTTMGSPEGLSHDVVLTVFQDSGGTMWFGTDAGLDRVKNGAITDWEGRESLGDETVSAIHEDREGRMWIGTKGAGVMVLEAGTWTGWGVEQGLAHAAVSAIAQDAAGAMWIGTVGGLTRISDGEVMTFTTEDGLPRSNVTAILARPDGSLVLGTWGGGIVAYRNGAFEEIGEGLSAAQRNVLTLHDHEGSRLSAGTVGGLVRIQDGKTTVLSRRHGLPEDAILQILEDDASNLWMSSNKGIFRISLESIERVASGQASRLDVVTYGVDEGMRSEKGVGGCQPSGWKDRSGNLWFATVGGAVQVDPGRVERPLPRPVVIIEKVLVDGNEVDVGSPVELQPGALRLEVRYTAPTFLHPGRVVFRYRLAGLEKEWIEAADRRIALYNNLPPGTYTFEVKARNRDGAWSEESASFDLVQNPFFYQTVWFYVACALGLVALGIAIPLIRIRQLRSREQQLVKAVDERTAELRDLALRDPLTGLRNRRFLFETIDGVMEDISRRVELQARGMENRRAPRLDDTMGVFMVDIDHFKRVNDTHGHDAGDRVLVQFAEVLGSCVRSNDIVVRWGGEEFLVVLPGTRRSFLEEFAERVRRKVAGTGFELPDGTMQRKTCSIGFTSYPVYEDQVGSLTVDQLIGIADLGLLMAKQEGRDRAVHVMGGGRQPVDTEDIVQMLSSLSWALKRDYLAVRRLTRPSLPAGASSDRD